MDTLNLCRPLNILEIEIGPTLSMFLFRVLGDGLAFHMILQVSILNKDARINPYHHEGFTVRYTTVKFLIFSGL